MLIYPCTYLKLNFYAFSNEDDDDANWTVDVSEEAVNKRMKELSMGVKGLAMDSDIEKTEPERVNILFEFIKKKLEAKVKKTHFEVK